MIILLHNKKQTKPKTEGGLSMSNEEFMNECEERVIKKYKLDIACCTNKDSVNKVYRQARIWNRFHHFYGECCSYERYTELNQTFKYVRLKKLKALNEGR